MKRHFKPRAGKFWVTLWVLVVLVGGALLAFVSWDWLNTPTSADASAQSNADTIRVIALVLGGATAVILALWRSNIAERQAKAAQDQSETAQLGLMNERYQRGAEMLGSRILTVRLGGIYTLQRLAEEHPQKYHVQIMRLFCVLARHPTRNETPTESGRLPLDIEAVMTAIALRSDSSIEIERYFKFEIDLHGAKLPGLFWSSSENVNLCGANFSDADLNFAHFPPRADLSRIDGSEANLSHAHLEGVRLCRANLFRADLSDAFLAGADLTDAMLVGTILTGANLRGVHGLTQDRLDMARAEADKPPNLEGSLYAKTGEPLI